MATEKVGVYRKWYGAVPNDQHGNPLPKIEWPRKRPFSWAVRWFGSNGKRYSRSFKSRKEAIKHAETRQAAVRVGKVDEPSAMTLTEFAKMYLDLRTDLAESTRVEQRRALRYLKEFIGEERTVSTVTPLDARCFIAWYRDRDYRDRKPAAATVNKLIRECKRIFREAGTCSLIRDNPFSGIRQAKVGQRPWHHITAPEYRQLVDAASSLRWQGMITLGYCCGLRLGEVLNLTWPDVDFERSRICIARKDASTQRAAWMPKDRDARIVPMPEQAAALLTRLQLAGADGQEYVFVTTRGPGTGDRLKRHNLWRDFQAIREKASVPKCSFHVLRKSYCTNLANAVPLHIVQELAGHADIRTTRRHYVQVHDEEIDSARRALEEVMRQ